MRDTRALEPGSVLAARGTDLELNHPDSRPACRHVLTGRRGLTAASRICNKMADSESSKNGYHPASSMLRLRLCACECQASAMPANGSPQLDFAATGQGDCALLVSLGRQTGLFDNGVINKYARPVR